ncbi:MAG TPA: RelA/SpoT family protein [bacterium]|mgnify:FL=1|jgi:GTP pyrophosphokinase|nr:bifunctional (p)ppGpp synthetase/guanosine-3',5'-bis(diphosphate) 3'-pyrophosphohydrolase [bacterium]MDX9806306.1 RelA/SpoT family protein [bacterium]HNW15524.1 RelA/SpoT family protein [bacterium]HOG43213.1 RelA/SpoT family protein [bacterium]HPY13719.1 RelA/SpoT family protein [bacterium]
MDRTELKTVLKRDPYIKLPKVIRPSHIIDAASEQYSMMKEEHIEEILEKIHKAIAVASSAHEGVVRKNGEPYIFHPYAVAYLLAKMGMDADCIIAGLLHDTVEDTTTTVKQIESMFGRSVANLVEGVTKLTEMKLAQEEKQAIAFKKLITFAKDDIRIIPIKLLDRLHNMMTLDAMPEEKQKRISSETMRFYAPLAHRLGFYWLKEELESLSFYFGMKDEWKMIDSFIENKYPNISETIQKLIGKVGEAIEIKSPDLSEKIYDIYGRAKSYFSIYKKTIRKNLEISSLHDILGVRVILGDENKDDCYLAMAAIHSYPEFTIINKYFKDYISRPKENGYMSIHTVVRYKEFFIEVQFRSKEMDRVAREGNASHWAYKNDVSHKDKVAKWLEEVLCDFTDSDNAIEFMSGIENVLPLDAIAVFSPKGDIFPLPDGSTLLDFAYAIHGDVGDQCIGGTVNGKRVTINHPLHSKDEVRVETSKNQVPRKDWLTFVKTAKAKQYIKRALSKKEKEATENRGREILKPLFLSQGRANDFENLRDLSGFAKIADRYSIPKKNRLAIFFAKLALGEIKLRRVVTLLFNSEEIEHLIEAFPNRVAPLFPEKMKKDQKPGTSTENPSIFIKNVGEIKDYIIAGCCQPVQGDNVSTYISPTRGYILHKSNCPSLAGFSSERIEKDVYWFEYSEYTIEFIVKLKNNKGALLELVEELTFRDFNIMSMHLNPEDAFEKLGNVYVSVKGSKIHEIESLSRNLKSKKSIIDLIISNIDY